MNLEATHEILLIDEPNYDVYNDENVNETTIRSEDVPFLVLFKVSVIMIFAPLIVCSNFLILVSLYRYKRLRTASNYFLASLASSDLGTGFCLPVTFYLQFSEKRQSFTSVACYTPFCLTIALCSASILTMAAIAVDRYTSLAQPLKYNNMITRTSVHRYLIGFWLYAFIVGFAPQIYKMSINSKKNNTSVTSINCSFEPLIDQTTQVFLFCVLFGPSALIILGCYCYVYVVARYHAKAIYTVELSVKQHQDCAHHRYGQTLAITVGLFILLWLPFHVCVLHDIITGTSNLRKWVSLYLTLPIAFSSALNPWIYAYRNTEIRTAVLRTIQDILKYLGYKSSTYSCPVNVIVASANANRVASSEFNNHVSSQLNLTNMTPTMRYTTVLMSSLHESDITSTTNNTIICRIETAACLAANDCKNLFDVNGKMQVTSC